MKRFLYLILLCVMLLPAVAEAQSGVQRAVVKTRGRINTKGGYTSGVRISDALVRVKGGGSYMSNASGELSFSVPSSGGYTIEQVYKDNYVLSDVDMLHREQKYSPTPLYLLLENSAELVVYRREIERQVRRNYQVKLDAMQAEIERLRTEGKATAEELQRLQEEIDRSWNVAEQYVDEMTDRYLLIDFDAEDEFDRELSALILTGELDSADSLLATRGNLVEDIRKVKISQQSVDNAREDAARRCYYKYEIALQRHERDSAAYWLEQRASLDRGNVMWQVEAARYIVVYVSDYDRAINIYENTLDYCTEHYGELHKNTALIYNNIGFVKYTIGDLNKALSYYEKAQHINLNISSPDCPDLAATFNNIGVVYRGLCKYDLALQYSNKALEIQQKKLSKYDLNIAITYNSLGIIYSDIGEYDLALDCFNRALEIRQKLLPEQSYEIADTYVNIGALYYCKANAELALDYFTKALDIQQKVLSPNCPSLATTYSNIGTVYQSNGDYHLALEYYIKALEIEDRVMDPDSPAKETSYNNIGLVYYYLDDFSSALEYYDKALEINKKILPPDNSNYAVICNNIAQVLSSQGNHTLALEYYDESLRIAHLTLSADNTYIASMLGNIGIEYFLLKDYDKAIEKLEASLKIWEKYLPDSSQKVEDIKELIEYIKILM